MGLIWREYGRDMAQAYGRIDAGGTTVNTACGPIEYTEFGQGPPMAMIHGAGGGYDQGAYFARLIDGSYRWIAPSRFGFLGTPVPAGADSALQADAHAALLDALGIERAGVVGVSMGGPSALLLAARHPDRVRSLALISAASHAIPPRPPIIAVLFNLFLNNFIFWALVRWRPGWLLAALGVPPEAQRGLSPEDVARLHGFLESIQPMSARRNGQLLEQHMSEIDAAQINRIEAPALILHARDDTLVAFEQGQFAAERIPGGQLIPMETGGHLALMLDMNAGARDALRAFLTKHNSKQGDCSVDFGTRLATGGRTAQPDGAGAAPSR